MINLIQRNQNLRKLNYTRYLDKQDRENFKTDVWCFPVYRMFSYGEFKAEDQEKMLAALKKNVEDVYRSCIGDNEANIK